MILKGNTKKKKSKSANKKSIKITSQNKRVILGFSLIFLGFILIISFVSYFFTWEADQSILSKFTDKEIIARNSYSKIGAFLGDFFIYKGFGIATLIPTFLLILTGIKIALKLKTKIFNKWFWSICWMVYLSISLGFLSEKKTIFSGVAGFEVNQYLQIYLGLVGTIMLLIFLFLMYLIFNFDVTPEKLNDIYHTSKEKLNAIKLKKGSSNTEIDKDKNTPSLSTPITITDEDEDEEDETFFIINKNTEEDEKPEVYTHESEIPTISGNEEIEEKSNISLQIEKHNEEESLDYISQKLVDDFGEFDPTLELSNYKFPTLELLNQPNNRGIIISEQELEDNKENIVQTLKHYSIEISKIQATIGPTVTLYEIVPAKGIRISKIKNLEDDIALSLAALGIRIIAPIPGKGTIGIEVPNKNPSIVYMSSMIGSPKFQNAEMELPIAFGKTISNETFVVDLAKMPHMLMAGATGQGKSVGLNVVLTSLLYKKHPAEVKFVLVDPKKVELTLFNKIERHYLAKLPDSEEAIITDNTKVINTLNSLCIEMDERYDLLQKAFVRNIKEYNKKFKARKLNPNDGHRFLPYIVLVVDEFADLIMTAGKEVELPIARLAQLARAIGIHLIIATQRPSVNVITGMIKANFPARVAFRVFSKIDSKTILDTSGADQLVGKGDMLFTQGSELVRLQCAFVDTPEVNHITDYIGGQRAYPNAYLLPEYIGEGSESSLDFDESERDELFREAAEVIVNAQQGSASLLQRKLKLGYNRAGRIIDQLEAAGIVGPFEGSKARQVLVNDIVQLDQLLNNN